ncbi:hypothetical protein [Hoyosella altamirensis]|uniref:Mce-associated membrane protein n=1 Tax=Hoyosella altamirensis TaxID=616997 RepID=A0A839RLS6_9ACTN|nr:hypothetical protein [Hoyosella altamirensis]MBB3037675.1 Mce-associated membrane protein [Hoyosella altamirensis]
MSDKTVETDPAPTKTQKSGGKLGAVVIALFVLAIIALGWVGFAWWKALDQAGVSSERDRLLGEARQAAVYLNSFDTNDLDATFGNIESVITGEQLRAEMEEARNQLESDAPSGGRINADVTDIAIVNFDPDSDEALAIAVVLRTTAGPTGQSVTQRVMMEMQLARVDGSWKVSASTQVGTPALVAESPGADGELPPELMPEGAELPLEELPTGETPGEGVPEDESQPGQPGE